MTFKEFQKTLNGEHPPHQTNPIIKALWYDAKGNWNQSHEIIQDIHSAAGSRIHAYLHRKEGDLGNAQYWYSRSGESMPQLSLDEEAELLIIRYLEE